MSGIPDDNEGKTPNLMIIWLDKHIGKSDECVLLKSSFFMAINPTTDLCEKNLNKDDIEQSICAEVTLRVRLDEVEFMFQAFADVQKCYETIEKNRNKRIFFITSGSKGEIIVPRLVSHFPEVFEPNYWIYIFCAKMNMVTTEGAGKPTNDWAFDYEDHVSMHNHQDDLLARLVLDIASYFFTEVERFEKSNQLNNALQNYQWSKIMYERYVVMDKRNVMKGKVDEVTRRITNIQQRSEDKDNMETDHTSQPRA